MYSLEEVRDDISCTLIKREMVSHCIPTEISKGGSLCPDTGHMGYGGSNDQNFSGSNLKDQVWTPEGRRERSVPDLIPPSSLRGWHMD